MIDVINHTIDVHAFDGRLVRRTSPPASLGGVAVSVDDGEGGNVHAITAYRQRNRITERITIFLHYGIVPSHALSGRLQRTKAMSGQQEEGKDRKRAFPPPEKHLKKEGYLTNF